MPLISVKVREGVIEKRHERRLGDQGTPLTTPT
jgi:hypothetical protein